MYPCCPARWSNECRVVKKGTKDKVSRLPVKIDGGRSKVEKKGRKETPPTQTKKEVSDSKAHIRWEGKRERVRASDEVFDPCTAPTSCSTSVSPPVSRKVVRT